MATVHSGSRLQIPQSGTALYSMSGIGLDSGKDGTFSPVFEDISRTSRRPARPSNSLEHYPVTFLQPVGALVAICQGLVKPGPLLHLSIRQCGAVAMVC